MHAVFMRCYQGRGEGWGMCSDTLCLEMATVEKLMCLSRTEFKLFNKPIKKQSSVSLTMMKPGV